MKDFIIVISLGALAVFGMYSCSESDWYKKGEAEKAAREAAEREPHIIRKKDGCDVYAFKVGDTNHYFTKCPNSMVSTDRQYTVSCGKNCHRQETETIVTETH
jgi:hypothetical protein